MYKINWQNVTPFTDESPCSSSALQCSVVYRNTRDGIFIYHHSIVCAIYFCTMRIDSLTRYWNVLITFAKRITIYSSFCTLFWWRYSLNCTVLTSGGQTMVKAALVVCISHLLGPVLSLLRCNIVFGWPLNSQLWLRTNPSVLWHSVLWCTILIRVFTSHWIICVASICEKCKPRQITLQTRLFDEHGTILLIWMKFDRSKVKSLHYIVWGENTYSFPNFSLKFT